MAVVRPVALTTGFISILVLAVTGCSGGGGGSAAPQVLITADPNRHSSPPPSAPAQVAATPSPAGTARVAASPSPAPSSVATPASTATASAAGYMQTSGVSDSAYTQIVNPGPWPSTFRPYCANAVANSAAPCPWNDSLPDNPSQLYPNSAAIVASIFAASSLLLPGDWSIAGDYNHPAYLAASTDPLVTVTCTAYCGVASATIAIPSAARAAGGNDGHMTIVEPDGTEWDMYQAGSYSGQTAFSVAGLYQTSILGSGQISAGGATSGAALVAGAIRSDELARGVVPHALFGSTNCVSGNPVYPGASQGTLCTSGTGPPIGARLQLTLTDAQISAMALPAWEAAILHAMHDYGVYILDTSGGSSPGYLYLRFESQTQYASYSATYPYSTMALNLSAFDSLLPWGSDFQIVAACYAQETCTQ